MKKEDTKLALEIAMSSMPYDRAEIFKLLIENDGVLRVGKIETSLNCSPATAYKIMKTLSILGLVDYEEITEEIYKVGRHPAIIKLKEEFKWILNTQSHFSNKNSFSYKKDSVYKEQTLLVNEGLVS